MFSNSTCSVPLVASLNGEGGNGNSNNGWGGDGWWVLIILFALIFGWGNNGWGNNNGSGPGSGGTQFIPYALGNSYTDASIQRGFDNQSVMNKLNGIEQGICSLGYDQLNQMNGINQNISQTGFGIQQAINADTVASMQNTNAIQSTLAGMSAQNQQCCCEEKEAIQNVNYNMSMQTNALQNTLCNNTRDIVASQEAGTRAVLDALTQQRIEAKDEKIADLQSLVNSLNLAQSQANQNTYLVNQLRPSPIPAYQVANPYIGYGIGYGCNSGCGCA